MEARAEDVDERIPLQLGEQRVVQLYIGCQDSFRCRCKEALVTSRKDLLTRCASSISC